MSWIKCPKCGSDTELYEETEAGHVAHQGHKMHELAKDRHPIIAAVGVAIPVGSFAYGLVKRRCKRCTWRFM
jgi:hypothetical protein